MNRPTDLFFVFAIFCPKRPPARLHLWLGRVFAGGLLFATSCVTPYNPETAAVSPRLVVEGLITDQPGPYRGHPAGRGRGHRVRHRRPRQAH